MKLLLRTYLTSYDLGAIAALAEQQRRVLSWLVTLTYEPDPLLSWRAIEAFGVAAAHIAEHDPEFVRVHLRRLLWLLSDESGGIGWRAPELLGDVLHRQPGQFPDFLPLLASLLDMEPEDAIRFRAGWLWAIGRVAEVAPEAMAAALPWVAPCLDDADPQVRGLAVWCLGRLGRRDILAARPELLDENSPVTLYCAGELSSVCMGELARSALESGPPTEG